MEKRIIQILIIFAIAFVIRALPLFLYGAWGNDIGIYYYIVKKMIESGQLYLSHYPGWGSSYNLFPILYLSAIITHMVFGFDILKALLIVGPVFGGASAVIIYFISRKIGLSRNASILASLILAVMPAHAYQTSHSAPLSVGHFFFLLSLLFFLKWEKSKKWFLPLLFSNLLLILSHHLTTYMYLVSIFAITLWRGWKGFKVKNAYIYISISSAITFLYWGLFAKPVYTNFMKGYIPFLSFNLFPIHIMAMWFILLFLSYFFIKRVRNAEIDILPSSLPSLFIIGFSISIISAIIGQIIRVELLSPYFIIWSIPTAITTGFATIGWKNLREDTAHPWLLALILSLFISSLLNFHSLIPERHIEYMCEPLAILASYGFLTVTKRINFRISCSRLPAAIAGALIFMNAISIYPAGEHAANIGEGIPVTTLNAIKWMHGNISSNKTIATDHRIGMLLFAEGFNTTYDKLGKKWYPIRIWKEDNWINCSMELKGFYENETCGKIYYIVIDDIMVKNGIFISKYPTFEFTNESYKKFWKEPFVLIYRNCTYADYVPPKINETIDYMDFTNETSMENVIHWTEIYKVDWNYIEEYERNTGKSN